MNLRANILLLEARLEKEIPGELAAGKRGDELLRRGWEAPTRLLGRTWKAFRSAHQDRKKAADHWRSFLVELSISRITASIREKALAEAAADLSRAMEERGLDRLFADPSAGEGILPYRTLRLLETLRAEPSTAGALRPELDAVETACTNLGSTHLHQLTLVAGLQKAQAALEEKREAWRTAWDAVDAKSVKEEIHKQVFVRNRIAINRGGLPIVLLFLKKPLQALVARIRELSARLPGTAPVQAVVAAGAATALVVGGAALHHHHAITPAQTGAGISRH